MIILYQDILDARISTNLTNPYERTTFFNWTYFLLFELCGDNRIPKELKKH